MKRVELVLALDVLERERALSIAKEVREHISYIKVNYPTVLTCGIDVLEELSKIKPVIADFKIADVPHVSRMISEFAFERDAKAVIVHGFSGRETVKAVLDVAKIYGGEVYVVTELTSSEEFFRGVSDRIAKMALELGCDGIVAPANRPERVKALKEIVGNLKVLCPGIGVQGGRLDVARYATHLIVGRVIYESENPKRSAEEINRLLQQMQTSSK